MSQYPTHTPSMGPTALSDLAVGMLKQPTGENFLDSGGESGRFWQKNIGKDLLKDPSATVTLSLTNDGVIEPSVYYTTISLLNSGYFELDETCNEFNSLPNLSGISHDPMIWDLSLEGEDFLNSNGFSILPIPQGGNRFENSFNTYNFGIEISQHLQGSFFIRDGDFGEEIYVLLQTHNGADVRGGYSDLKLLRLQDSINTFGSLGGPINPPMAIFCTPIINLTSPKTGEVLTILDGVLHHDNGEPLSQRELSCVATDLGLDQNGSVELAAEAVFSQF